MKYIILITLALMVSVGCKKKKPEREVTIGKSQNVRYSQDSVAFEQSTEVVVMEEGSTLTREIKGKTWPSAWGGPGQVTVYVNVKAPDFEKVIYQESKLEHNINVTIP